VIDMSITQFLEVFEWFIYVGFVFEALGLAWISFLIYLIFTGSKAPIKK